MKRTTIIGGLALAALLLGMAPVADAQGPVDPLAGTAWWVEDIQGGGVIDNAHTTVEFAEDGRVGGDGGCNRYMGSYERDGDALSFGRLAGTLKACPPALMNQERRFHGAMEQVRGWRIDPRTGLLHLLDEAGDTVIRAARVREEPAPDGEA